MNEEIKKRPLGVTILAVVWTFGAISNLYFASQNIGFGISGLAYLPELPKWFRSAIPVELVLNVVLFGVGLVQVLTAYGLWTGKSWSSKLFKVAMFLVLFINVAGAVLYMSYPPELIPEWGPIDAWDNIIQVTGGIFWLVVYIRYLKKPHVQKYLGLETYGLEPTETLY